MLRSLFPKQLSNLKIAMAFATAYMRLIDLPLDFGAVGFNEHFASKAQKAFDDPSAQLHMLTGVGARNSGHGAVFAYIGNPRLAGRVALNELTDLFTATAIEIGIIKRTFLTIRCAHEVIIQ